MNISLKRIIILTKKYINIHYIHISNSFKFFIIIYKPPLSKAAPQKHAKCIKTKQKTRPTPLQDWRLWQNETRNTEAPVPHAETISNRWLKKDGFYSGSHHNDQGRKLWATGGPQNGARPGTFDSTLSRQAYSSSIRSICSRVYTALNNRLHPTQ